MSLEEDYLIERFLKGELSSEEEVLFRERLESDSELLEKVTFERQLFETLNENEWSRVENPDTSEVREYSDLFASEEAKAIQKVIADSGEAYKSSQGSGRRLWWLYPSAAVLLLFVSFYFLFPRKTPPEGLYNAYLEKTELPSLITRGEGAMEIELSKGQTLFENKEFAKAVEVFSELVEIDDQNAALYIYLALSQAERTQFDQAQRTLDELIASDLLDSQKGFWFKSLVYLKSDQPAESLAVLKAIVQNRYFNDELARALLEELE